MGHLFINFLFFSSCIIEYGCQKACIQKACDKEASFEQEERWKTLQETSIQSRGSTRERAFEIQIKKARVSAKKVQQGQEKEEE